MVGGGALLPGAGSLRGSGLRGWPLYLLHLHLHGLFRGRNPELGRDADTGGQTLYVLELVKALAAQEGVERVEVVTRLIEDRRVSSDYSRREETVCPGAHVVRLPFGPRRYLRKELLWPHLDELADELVHHICRRGRRPHWLHAHYADGGYVGALVSRRLEIPLLFTGHSLGREKLRRLLATGQTRAQIEKTYAMSLRIDAEELALAQSRLVVTSTRQEATDQYARYGRFHPELATVIAPGVNLERFRPARENDPPTPELDGLLGQFLREPRRPPVLALSRADRRKNIPALVAAFGSSERLRRQGNLVLLMGSRQDIRKAEREQREVFQQVLELVDYHNLYGQVAYPKQLGSDQVPQLYRWAAQRGGVFVNPALTEPFGLTLLEAAASGLPVVATDDGGPRDILGRCRNGLLADVTNIDQLRTAIERLLGQPKRWQTFAQNGLEAVQHHYSWAAHARRYLGLGSDLVKDCRLPRSALSLAKAPVVTTRLGRRLFYCDLDGALSEADQASLQALNTRLQATGAATSFGILTGVGPQQAKEQVEALGLPPADVWICRNGTDVSYGPDQSPDLLWRDHIGEGWNRAALEDAMAEFQDCLTMQSASQQSDYKLSYWLKGEDPSLVAAVRQTLCEQGLRAQVTLVDHVFLDVLPFAGGRPDAIRHVALQQGIPLEHTLVAASQHGDGEVLRGLLLGVVPADHDPSLDDLRQQRSVFFARRPQAWGILEGMDHYRFFAR